MTAEASGASPTDPRPGRSVDQTARLGDDADVAVADFDVEQRRDWVIDTVETDPVTEDDRGFEVLSDVDLSVRSGEVVGIAGVSGNGQVDLAESLVGEALVGLPVVGPALFENTPPDDLALGSGVPLADLVNPTVSVVTNPRVMAMYPYLATVVVLVATTRNSLEERVGAPAALLDNYSRELE